MGALRQVYSPIGCKNIDKMINHNYNILYFIQYFVIEMMEVEK